jgi:hypothetical protein
MTDTPTGGEKRYVGYYSDDIIPVVTRNAGTLYMKKGLLHGIDLVCDADVENRHAGTEHGTTRRGYRWQNDRG